MEQNIDIIILLAVILGAIIAFFKEWLPLEVTALSATGILLLTDVITVEETLSGFSNKAVIIIGAIFIISKSLVKTGFLEVIADKRKIIQVIVNLLDNAIRFTSESGKILISTSQNDGMVEVVVEDNGTGISAEEQKHVFERFYKVDTSRSGSGTGLGLAIAKHIVMAHEGNLLLDSQPGEGSKFSFKLRKT